MRTLHWLAPSCQSSGRSRLSPFRNLPSLARSTLTASRQRPSAGLPPTSSAAGPRAQHWSDVGSSRSREDCEALIQRSGGGLRSVDECSESPESWIVGKESEPVVRWQRTSAKMSWNSAMLLQQQNSHQVYLVYMVLTSNHGPLTACS